MGYSRDIGQFWKCLEDPNAVLTIDNDMCYVALGDESLSFDFGPKDLVFIMSKRLDIQAESV